MHLFLSAACWKRMCFLSPELSSVLCLFVAASDDSMVSFKRLVCGSTIISSGSGKHSTPQNSRKSRKQNLSLKISLSFSFSTLISLTTSINKKKISEWGKKKKELDTNFHILPTIPTINRNHDKPFRMPHKECIFDSYAT